MTSEADVWVNGYTTSSGVQVAGHWRRRISQIEVADATAASRLTASSSAPSPLAHPVSVSPGAAPGTSPERLTTAVTRYRSALVAVGVCAIRQRRGQATDYESALQERAAARSELDDARLQAAGISPPRSASLTSAQAPVGDGISRCPGCGQYNSSGHQCPTPDGLPGGDYAGLKGDERVKAMVGDLESSVQAIVESGQLHRWLDAMASNGLSRWSANNRILAAVQMLQRGQSLEDLHMMGFRQWSEKFNRKVSKGAKAVWILAPVTRKVIEEDDAGNSTEHRRVVGFKGVPVFNISDTHGDPLPSSPTRPIPGAATPGTVEGLRDRVAHAGYSYQEVEIPGCRPDTGEGTLGYTEPASKRIVIDSRLSGAQKASTIAHELGHVHCGHVEGDYSEYQRHRGQMETEAEAVAFLTMKARGASNEQAHSFSPAYIAGWSRGDAKVVHAAIDKAVRAYNKIMEGDWPVSAK